MKWLQNIPLHDSDILIRCTVGDWILITHYKPVPETAVYIISFVINHPQSVFLDIILFNMLMCDMVFISIPT